MCPSHTEVLARTNEAPRAPGSDVSREATAPTAPLCPARALSDSWKALAHTGLTEQRSACEGAFSFMKNYLILSNGDHCGQGQFESGFGY